MLPQRQLNWAINSVNKIFNSPIMTIASMTAKPCQKIKGFLSIKGLVCVFGRFSFSASNV
ncbi:MAG: hypothetical protein ACI8O8_001989 [Oleiphilaceae bacterium]|jgi:hypothetical protein